MLARLIRIICSLSPVVSRTKLLFGDERSSCEAWLCYLSSGNGFCSLSLSFLSFKERSLS